MSIEVKYLESGALYEITNGKISGRIYREMTEVKEDAFLRALHATQRVLRGIL